MARPKRDVARTCITLERTLLAEIHLFLGDPAKDKLRYGSLSTIVSRLLTQLLREMQKPNVNPADVLRRYGVDIGD